VKRCSRCGEWKERWEFYRRRASRDGLSGWCKACKRAYDAKWYSERGGRTRFERGQYAKSARRRAARKAYTYLRRAIQKGLLERPPACEECGEACALEGHHDNYADALVVRFLCRECHGKRGKKSRLDSRRETV
jgi:hypothetical protein